MAASVSFELTSRFPAGTTVGAYRRRTFPGGPPQPGQVPLQLAHATAVVSPDGVAVFQGLDAEAGYYAGASVNGAWRWVRFGTLAPDATDEQLRAEAAERRIEELVEAAEG